MASSVLSEDRRSQLSDIVGKMESNKESPEDIKLVVDSFKNKYSNETPIPQEGSGLKNLLSAAGQTALNIVAPGIGGAISYSQIKNKDILQKYSREKAQTLIDKIPDLKSQSVPANFAAGIPKAGLEVGADLASQYLTPEGAALAIVPMAPGAAKIAEGVAENSAVRSLGFTKRFLRNVFTRQEAKAAAMVASDEGIIGAFTGPGKMLENVLQKKEAAGEAIGNFLKSQKEGISVDGLVSRLEDLKTSLVKDGLSDQLPKVDSAISAVRARALGDISTSSDPLINAASGGKEIPLLDASRLKTIYQMRGKFNKDSAQQETERMISGVLRKHIDETLKDISNGIINQKQFQEFLKNKRIYGAFSKVEDGLINRLSSKEGNRAIGYTDIILAAPHLASGNPISAIATIGIKHLGDDYGANLTQVSASAMAKLLRGIKPSEASLILNNKTAFLTIASQIQKHIPGGNKNDNSK